MKEEIKKILQMIEEGHITAEEGEDLIEALSSTQDDVWSQSLSASGSPSVFKDTCCRRGKNKVNVTIPISLISRSENRVPGWTKIFTKQSTEEIDLDELMQQLRKVQKVK